MPSPFHFARTWELNVPPDKFWETISHTGEYRTWWPWLREFDADGMREGAQWKAVIQSPLPYVLRVHLELGEVVECERLSAGVTGDIEGWAVLELAPSTSNGGSTVDVEWDMRPRSRAMQAAAVLARPLLRWSHEWVLARGLDQFRQRALTNSDGERSDGDQ